jgi:hypothetical protein
VNSTVKLKAAAFFACIVLLLAGCSSSEGNPGDFEAVFHSNSFSSPEEIAENVKIDFSTSSEGYSGISVVSEKNIKVLLTFGETQYVFNVPKDGTTAYIPFPCGDGKYELRVMQNTVDNKYIELAKTEIDVALADEFTPFIHSNLLVKFDEDSACVKKAAELAAQAPDDTGFMKLVYELIKNSVTYDDELAETVAAGYVPEPDITLDTKKGICLDYAALAAAMLRSQGVPTKVITGYVGEEALYHAWNAVYLKDSGWIAVELRINPNDWTKFDLTYAASETIESKYIYSFVY